MNSTPAPTLSPDQALASVAQATACLIGEDFLHAVVDELARTLDARLVFVTRALNVPTTRVQIVVASQKEITDAFDLAGTPCELVYKGHAVAIEEGVSRQFEPSREWACESFFGYPFYDGEQTCIGHLGLFFVEKTSLSTSITESLTRFANRIGAELLRLEMQTRLESTRRQLDFQNRILQMAARHEPRDRVLDSLLAGIESEHPDMLCSLMLPTADGRAISLTSAPSLPPGYSQNLQRVPIKQGIGSCGTAAFSGQRVIIEDIATHPYWASARHLALPHGLRSCWSQPVHDAAKDLLGVFAIYKKHPGLPTSAEIELIESIAALVNLVLEHYRMNAALEEKTHLYQLLLRTSADGMAVVDQDGRFVEISDGFLQQLGAHDRSEIAGSRMWNWDAIVDESSTRHHLASLSEHPVMYETRRRRIDGSIWDAEISAAAFKHGEQTLIWTSARDITERKQMEAELIRRATFDELTGLHNRATFMRQLEAEFQRSQRHGHPLSVLMLDIDHFKLINDNFGHQAGDKALQAVSSVCRACLRKEDGVGRIGGEEFAFILPETDLAGAEEVAEKLRQLIERLAIHHQDQAIDIRTSIGCATLDGSEASHESLLSHADQALYQAKAMGRNRIHAYQNEF